MRWSWHASLYCIILVEGGGAIPNISSHLTYYHCYIDQPSDGGTCILVTVVRPNHNLKNQWQVTHHTGHLEGNGVKILMCHISLAQGRNAVVQWQLPGSISAIFLHSPACKSCGPRKFAFFCHLYVALDTATEPIRLQGTKSLPHEAPHALVARCSPELSEPRVSHHTQQVPIWRH